MLRRFLLASAGALALTGAALAADLLPPPPPPPPPPLWTGFYIGFNLGGTWSDGNTVNTATAGGFGNPALVNGVLYGPASAALATLSLPSRNGGFIGGGQIGYNYQFAPRWLAGIEADFQGVAAGRGSSFFSSALKVAGGPNEFLIQTTSASKIIDSLGTVRGRLGYLITPTLLLYVDGGFAYGWVSANTNIVQAITAAPGVPSPFASFGGLSSGPRVGWTAGGGGEWLFLPNWSVKVEYLYYDLGRATYALSPLISRNAAGAVFTVGQPVSSTRFRGNVIRAGINYHFNWFAPAPIVAKY